MHGGWLTCLWALKCAALTGDLINVQVITRHGHRLPAAINPKDLNQWSGLGNPGEMTPIGLAQAKAQGLALKRRYVRTGFLPDVANSERVNLNRVDLKTTSSGRAQVTLFSILDGLFPEEKIPMTIEDELLVPLAFCPYDDSSDLDGGTLSSELFSALMTSDPDLFDTLTTITGWPKGYGSGALYTIYDNLEAAEEQNTDPGGDMGPAIDIPEAVHDAKQMLEEFYFARGVAPYITWDNEKGLFNIKFANEVLSNILQQAAGQGKQLNIYSGHAATWMSISAILDLFSEAKGAYPVYAQSLVIEARQVSTGEVYVSALQGVPSRISAGKWTYKYQPLQLSCPEPQDECSLQSWVDFLVARVPAQNITGGCCFRGRSWDYNQCGDMSVPFSQKAAKCRLYRKHCPYSACDPPYFLHGGTNECQLAGNFCVLNGFLPPGIESQQQQPCTPSPSLEPLPATKSPTNPPPSASPPTASQAPSPVAPTPDSPTLPLTPAGSSNPPTPGPPSGCLDDATFSTAYGFCSDYAPGTLNHQFCVSDGAKEKCCLSCWDIDKPANPYLLPPLPTPSPTAAVSTTAAPTSSGSECLGDNPDWRSDYGRCVNYMPGRDNHPFCDLDGATPNCCAACGEFFQKALAASSTSSPSASDAAVPPPTQSTQPLECVDDPTWASPYGFCNNYIIGNANHEYCEQDGAWNAATNTGPCCQACTEQDASAPNDAGGSSEEVACFDDPTFRSPYGRCSDYAVGRENHPYCVIDGAHESCGCACADV